MTHFVNRYAAIAYWYFKLAWLGGAIDPIALIFMFFGNVSATWNSYKKGDQQ